MVEIAARLSQIDSMFGKKLKQIFNRSSKSASDKRKSNESNAPRRGTTT